MSFTDHFRSSTVTGERGLTYYDEMYVQLERLEDLYLKVTRKHYWPDPYDTVVKTIRQVKRYVEYSAPPLVMEDAINHLERILTQFGLFRYSTMCSVFGDVVEVLHIIAKEIYARRESLKQEQDKKEQKAFIAQSAREMENAQRFFAHFPKATSVREKIIVLRDELCAKVEAGADWRTKEINEPIKDTTDHINRLKTITMAKMVYTACQENEMMTGALKRSIFRALVECIPLFKDVDLCTQLLSPLEGLLASIETGTDKYNEHIMGKLHIVNRTVHLASKKIRH